jgi:NAD(P)-dependent dehydrogenase (short-subunit alcohol dehydrogenase family)
MIALLALLFLTQSAVRPVAAQVSNASIRPISTIFTGSAPLVAPLSTCGKVSYSFSILEASIIADVSGSASVDVRTVLASSYTGLASASSITAASPIALSSAYQATNTALTGWTKTIAPNTVVCFVLTSSSSIKTAQVSLKVVQ